MNTKNNKRRQTTQSNIEKAFIKLLMTHDISKITVSDICTEVGCNRSTFYANYEDIYALADSIRDQLAEQVKAICDGDITTGFTTGSAYLSLLRHIKDNQFFYKTYFKLGYDNDHQVTLADMEEMKKKFPQEHLDYHIEFFRAGFNAIVKKWLSGGCKESPEEISDVLKSEYLAR